MRCVDKAMTLMEVVVAMGLLGLALLSILAIFTSSLTTVKITEELTDATDIAQEMVERIRNRGFLQLPPGSNVFDGRVPTPILVRPTLYDFPPSPYPRTVRNGRTYEIMVIADPINVNLTSLIVDVHWTSEGPHRLSLETYLHP